MKKLLKCLLIAPLSIGLLPACGINMKDEINEYNTVITVKLMVIAEGTKDLSILLQ
jgi:hypothetical protein